MRTAGVSVACALALVACGAIVHACGGSGDSGGAPTSDASTGDAAPEAAPITEPLACVKSPTPAPFPSGACESPKPTQTDSFDEALTKIGIDRCSLALLPNNVAKGLMVAGDPRRMTDFTAVHLHPLRLPAYGAETASWLDAAVAGANPVSSAIAAAAVRRGTPIADCPDPAWAIVDGNDAAPLASVVAEIAIATGADFDAAAAIVAVKGVPLDLQRALVAIVRAIGYGARDIADARAPAMPALAQLKLVPAWVIGTYRLDTSAATLAALDGVDVGKMALAANRIASAVESAKLDRFAGTDTAPLDLDTPFGPIVLRGKNADTYMPGGKAETSSLVLDLGGDDTYRVAVAAATWARPVSIAIDLGGKDLYGYVEKPVSGDMIGHRLPSDGGGRQQGITASRTLRQGAANLGIALLFDLGGGNDTYRSLAVSQGVGVHGVGVLYDDGGDDAYTSEALSQGAAAFGIGLLLDRAGSDKYVAYNTSQGFGFTKGFGAIADLAGDDSYYADPGDPSLGGDAIYPNGQLPGPPNSTLIANTSLSQGCGYGFRPDSPNPGFQFAGGMGVLRDAAGNDAYTVSVFGQGCAFAMGIGLFLEGAGNDVYEGLWYVQGANAHTAVSLFWDAAGNDKYNPTFPIQSTSIGVGHDFSVAVHYDADGDDTYKGPNLSLGSGNANGIGVLVNVGGVDVFNAASINTLGAANVTEVASGSRLTVATIGVFVKAKGSGSYVVGGMDAGYTGSAWSYAPNIGDGGAPQSGEKSVGIDRPSGAAVLP